MTQTVYELTSGFACKSCGKHMQMEDDDLLTALKDRGEVVILCGNIECQDFNIRLKVPAVSFERTFEVIAPAEIVVTDANL